MCHGGARWEEAREELPSRVMDAVFSSDWFVRGLCQNPMLADILLNIFPLAGIPRICSGGRMHFSYIHPQSSQLHADQAEAGRPTDPDESVLDQSLRLAGEEFP